MANDPPETPPSPAGDAPASADADAPEVDEELASLSSTPPRRSPVVAIAVIVLAGLVLFHLRANLVYAFRSRTPTDLGQARGLQATPKDNTFATVRGQPDFRNALSIEPRGQRDRETFFRLLGSDSRIFVRALDTTQRAGLAAEWTGRLRRFDSLPYAASLRGYFAHSVKARRFLAPSMLKDALARPAGAAVQDRAGQPIALAADAPLTVDFTWDDRVLVLMSQDRYATAGDAQHELERAGFHVAAIGAPSEDDFALYVLAPAAQRNAVIDQLDKAGYRFRAADERLETRRSDLQSTSAGLLFASATQVAFDGTRTPAKAVPIVIPWDRVQAASVSAPVTIGPDAWVLTEGEAPGRFWWAPLLAFLLVGFALFNGWYLVVRRRPA